MLRRLLIPILVAVLAASLTSATSLADPLWNLSINDVSITEGTPNATFTVTLDVPSPEEVTVDYATADDGATAGEDYTGTSGTLTIPALALSAQISVPVLDDALDEAAEGLTVTLSARERSATTIHHRRCRSTTSRSPRVTRAARTRPLRSRSVQRAASR